MKALMISSEMVYSFFKSIKPKLLNNFQYLLHKIIIFSKINLRTIFNNCKFLIIFNNLRLFLTIDLKNQNEM